MPENSFRDVGLRRVAIDASSQVVGGGVSVARNLTSALAREAPEVRFTIFCSSDQVGRGRFPENVQVEFEPALAGFRRRTGWEQSALPRLLREGHYDALLNLGGFAVGRCPVPQVSVWQNPNIFTQVRVRRRLDVNAYIWVQRIIQGVSMRRADLNVFLTQESLKEASTRWDMGRIAHVVIPNGVEVAPVPEPVEGLPTEPFLLAVGHSYFHKNYEALIDAMACYRDRFGPPPPMLVAGGAVDSAYHETLEQRIRDRGLGDVVRFLGPQPPDRVASLYARASVYVMTSVLESFGLTPLEAMAHGTPVVAADASCIPEVCGDAAIYCDPRDPVDIAGKLHRVLGDGGLRERLRARGRARVERFSWAESARRYLGALASCVAASDPSRHLVTARRAAG